MIMIKNKQGPSLFRKLALTVAYVVGTSRAFFVAMIFIIVWLLTGPVFGFSDTWQLVINTVTTIITFLMVFLIQNTQNRDSKASLVFLKCVLHALYCKQIYPSYLLHNTVQ